MQSWDGSNAQVSRLSTFNRDDKYDYHRLLRASLATFRAGYCLLSYLGSSVHFGLRPLGGIFRPQTPTVLRNSEPEVLPVTRLLTSKPGGLLLKGKGLIRTQNTSLRQHTPTCRTSKFLRAPTAYKHPQSTLRPARSYDSTTRQRSHSPLARRPRDHST